ncbi:MAG TPA: AMP-binding protein, partial [Actinomycetota bacterium]|nr:AMP-binding protein [Actinomycetota bacterium]
MRTTADTGKGIDPEGISERTTVGVFFRHAAKYGDRALIHHRIGDAWSVKSWNAMRQDVLSVASALIEAGVKSGDSVIVMSENRVEWLICDFGIQAAGAVTVPIYPNTPPEVARTIAEDSLAVLAIVSDSQLAAKLPAGGSLQQVVLMDREVHAWTDRGPTRLAEVDARLRAIRPD